MYRLKYMGKYGSSDPHLKSDWIEVNINEPSGVDGIFDEGEC